MKKQIGEYRHLAGGSRTGGTLWEGPDHLLYLERSGRFLNQSETPKRIDYANIQCISFARTSTWWWATVLLGLLACLFAIVAARTESGPDSAGRLIFYVAATAFIGAAFLVHLTKGPTCIVKIQTAVQLHHLRPLRRLRPARKFAEHLSALCRAHQGDTPVDLEALLQNGTQPSPAQRFIQKAKPPFAGSVLLRWTLGALLLSGAMLAGEPFVDHIAYLVSDLSMLLVTLILTVAGLYRSGSFKLPPSLKFSLWGGIANLGIIALFFYALLIFRITKQSLAGKPPAASFNFNLDLEQLRWFSHAGFAELHQFAWSFVALGCLSVCFALIGLPAVAKKIAPPSAPTPPPLPKSNPAAMDSTASPQP